MRVLAAAALAAFLVAGCSEAPREQRRDNEKSLREYVDSAKGRADLAKARADGERRFGGKGTGNATTMRWVAAEGTWAGTLGDGSRLLVGISRDGGGSMELVGSDGRSAAHASTSVSLVGTTVHGTATRPPAALAPWSQWTLSADGTGARLTPTKGDALAMIRQK